MRIYLEANPLIAAMEGADPTRSQMTRLLQSTGTTLVSSELTLAEVLVKPLRRRLADGDDLSAAELVLAYEAMFDETGLFDAIPVSTAMLRRAAEIRAGRGSLKLPDAIHLATALWARCDVLVTDDDRLQKAAADRTTVCSLDPADLDALLARIEAS